MDFGDTIYFLLHFTETEIEDYLDNHYGKFQMYFGYETKQDVERKENPTFMDELLRRDSELIETCCITGQTGMCRPITLCN